ncbi:MAG TPA: 3-deoxy-7-phosphoheptulonate synthase [Anaerolineae bacterium]|nr:3-deoxy-7-phosphoheptulonate synthase [Anaerolineae bacterium]
MIVVMNPKASATEINAVIARVQSLGATPHPIHGEFQTVVAVVGDVRGVHPDIFLHMAGVEKVAPISHPFKLASRDTRPEDTIISLNGVCIGGRELAVMAGPCSVESREQLLETAWAVKEAGAVILRGGAFKPRTSPYSFQGLGLRGLEMLAEAREETGLYIITEVMNPDSVPLVAEYADILQIGARNMQNYGLLHAVGQMHKPVLLKRGMMSTMEELLMSAEYILAAGNYNVMLCERGIRTFERYTRNTFDLSAIPVLKQLSHLPIIADPSHGTGRWDIVTAMSRAAVAAGADGLIIEVHPRPEEALSDGAQSLKPERFAQLMREVRRVAEAVDRTLRLPQVDIVSPMQRTDGAEQPIGNVEIGESAFSGQLWALTTDG